MNKHQTLVYLKYGNLINEINDKITDSTLRSDMIKFLVKVPGNLIYPTDIYQPHSDKNGRFQFEITKSSKINYIFIDFDGNNNFNIWSFNKWPSNFITWASIDDIDHYVGLYPNYYNNILE